jgi:hypothetical protein
MSPYWHQGAERGRGVEWSGEEIRRGWSNGEPVAPFGYEGDIRLIW